jgi:hypothetical protein
LFFISRNITKHFAASLLKYDVKQLLRQDEERPTGLHQQPAGCKKQNRPRRLQKCHQSSLLGNKALVEIQGDISVGSPRRRINPVGPTLNR